MKHLLRWMNFTFLCIAVTGVCQMGAIAAYRPPNHDNVYSHVDNDRKMIALTFDDGPHPKYTPQILDILAEYNIKATFFEIGANIGYYPETARRVYEAGHEIGNHTYTHPQIGKITKESLKEELDKAAALVKGIAGNAPTLIRPPQGVCNEDVMNITSSQGATVVLWTIDTLDWQGTDPDIIESKVLEDIRAGDILLFHDYVSCRNTTIPALKKLIPQLIERGYTFVTVSELIDFSDGGCSYQPRSIASGSSCGSSSGLT